MRVGFMRERGEKIFHWTGRQAARRMAWRTAGWLCLMAFGGALALHSLEAAAEPEHETLQRGLEGQIEANDRKIDELRREISRAKRALGRCENDRGDRSSCSNQQAELNRLKTDKQNLINYGETLQRNQTTWEANVQQAEAHQEAALKKVKKQEKIHKISAALAGTAAVGLFAACASATPTAWHLCALGLLAGQQAMSSLGEAAKLDGVCGAIGDGPCHVPTPNDPGPPKPGSNCLPPPAPQEPCRALNETPPVPPPGGPDGNPTPQPTLDIDPKKLNEEFPGCSFDPGCFTTGPDGDIVMNEDALPDGHPLKGTTFAGGDKEISDEDIIKKLSPKNKARFASAVKQAQSQNPALASELEALQSEMMEDGDEEGEEEGDGAAGGGKISDGAFQGGADSAGAAGAAGGSGGGGRRGRGGGEEDSIEKQVQALLNKVKGRRGKKGRKGKGAAGKPVTIGNDQVGAIDENIFMMIRRRYQILRKDGQFIEEGGAGPKRRSSGFLDSLGI